MIFVTKNTIRTLFSRAMSNMYQREVPQYKTLMDIVSKVNDSVLQKNPQLKQQLKEINALNRINEERHGAIRLGTPQELRTIRQLFAVMGMYPVNYYDLTVAGIPVHSTAFRPIEDVDLQNNPFRVFTSLLRIDLIEDAGVRHLAKAILAKRDIFTPETLSLIHLSEAQGGLTQTQAKEFVAQAIQTFRWQKKATVDLETYQSLKKIHPLAADVVCFAGPHINHLTPRTLDIVSVQKQMPEFGLNPKAVIEGPPTRNIPILLQQTSFKALQEDILFPKSTNEYHPGTHQARFGEIEQRGAALTPKGKNLYESLLSQVREMITPTLDGSNAQQYYDILNDIFKAFPDDLATLRLDELIYCEYHPTQKGLNHKNQLHNLSLDELIKHDYVNYNTIIYEDFLPVSAAGIFTSNLGDDAIQTIKADANQAAFESDLGTAVIDGFNLYARKEQKSLQDSMTKLGIKI